MSKFEWVTVKEAVESTIKQDPMARLSSDGTCEVGGLEVYDTDNDKAWLFSTVSVENRQ